MALRITTELVKFKHLLKDLDLKFYEGIGLLESIWHFTAKNAIQGDIGRHSNQEIADWIGWTGNADKLIECLVIRRWLDKHSIHRLIVHEWEQHADKSLKTTMKNKKLEFCQPDNLTMIPKNKTGIPEKNTGYPPGSGSGAESESGPGAGPAVFPQGVSLKAVDVQPFGHPRSTVVKELEPSPEESVMAQEFWMQIPGTNKSSLNDFSDIFRAKLQWLDANGRGSERSKIWAAIRNPKRDKEAVNNTNKMFLFWQECGLDSKANGKPTETVKTTVAMLEAAWGMKE